MRIRTFIIALLLGLTTSPAAARDALAEALALPLASGLTGAADAPRFAWVENAAGVRNVWVATPGQPARQVTAYTQDDGQPIYDLNLSRDGRTLAFVRGGDGEFPDDERPNPASDSEPPRQQIFLTTGDAPPIVIGEGRNPVFSPDGRQVAFAREEGQLWLWDAAAGARRIARIAGSVSRLGWSPDGRRLVFVDVRSGRSFIALFDIGGTRVRYIDPGIDQSAEPAFSPDGKQLAFVRYVDPPAGAGPDTGPYWSLRIADVATGASRLLWAARAGPGARFAGTRSRNLFWTASGQIIFPSEAIGWLHPQAIPADGSRPPRELTPGAFEVETFVPTRDGRSLIYAANAGDLDRRHLWRVPVSGGAAVQLTGGDGIESYPTLGGDALAAIATDATHPAHPVLVAGALAPLGKRPEAIGFRKPEAVIFRAADGVTVHAQLIRGNGPGPHPALVYIHGGPRRQMLLGYHPSGYYSHGYATNQIMAARGYHVLSINYRSGTGYGLAFRDAAETGREGASEYRDIVAGGRWLAAQADVDAARIGVWGGSWGGYLTALALARDSDLFKVGVDFHGVHTLLRAVPDTLSPEAQLAARRLQWSSSPMGSIDRWRSPVLLIHGDDDRNVPFSQSLLLARELAARRIPYRDIAFPNERHSFVRHEPWLTSLRATVDFIDATLKP